MTATGWLCISILFAAYSCILQSGSGHDGGAHMADETTMEATEGDQKGAVPRLRVGIAGATGYAGQELVRILARHPHGVADDGDGVAGHQHAQAPARSGPHLGWRRGASRRGGPRCRGRHDLSGAPRSGLCRPRAAIARRRSARRRSVGGFPSSGRGRTFQVVPGHRRACPTAWPTVSPSSSWAPSRPRGCFRTRAVTRPPRCSRCYRSPGRACWYRAPTSSLTRSRGSRAPAKPRPTARTSARTTAASPPTLRSAIATRRRWSRPWARR